MPTDLRGKLRRGIKKPPAVILRRVRDEACAELERFLAPRRLRWLNEKKLAAECKAANLGELWERMAQSPHPFPTAPLQTNAYEALCPGDKDRILGAADAALRHEVNLLGSGKVLLGENIDWSRDYKTGASWPNQYFRNIDYANPDQPSDVKFPWELSRMQWLIPAGQAYLLTGEEKYAVGVRKVLESWIAANPYAHSVNWACAMEAAMRLIVWSWLFRVFNANDSWADVEFRTDFLICFYLHGDFTLRHIERTDINGNHYTADAAGLVFAGLLLGKGHKPELWARTGWSILCEELPRQVHADGVDFEASTAYHRLVAELFLLPAMYRTAMGLDVPEFYRERLTGMGRFTAAYTQPDGQAPFWGDADDARTLPFGGQSINDHRYLSAMIGHVFEDEDLLAGFSGSAAELVWGVGLEAARNAKARARARDVRPESQAFTEGGFYIASNDVDHVFIDCGPVGLGGRGGHGHNDCLSFEAILDGEKIVTDCGAYLYTSSYKDRNKFRSTACHNTPQVDGEEINRFVRPDYLWSLHYDATPQVHAWNTDGHITEFVGSHAGYSRLEAQLAPKRRIRLEHASHTLTVTDEIRGSGDHHVEIPLHLAAGVDISEQNDNGFLLEKNGKLFRLTWLANGGWQVRREPARVSPSYGVVTRTLKLLWCFDGLLPAKLVIVVVPVTKF